MKILIIDDEQFFADNLCAYLDGADEVECYCAANSGQALGVFRDQDVDLVICDLRLADESGEAAMKQISALKNDQPFIVISAYQIPDSLKFQKNMNIIGYFEKPFDLKEFKAFIISKYSI